MAARDVPEAVEVRGALAVESEERPPRARRGDRERQVHQEPRAGGRPRQPDRPVGSPIAQTLHDQGERQHPRIELRRGADPERGTGGHLASSEEVQEAHGGEGHGEQVPVHRAVDHQRGRQREVERARAVHHVETDRDQRGTAQQHQGVHQVEAGVVVAREPPRGADEVHRDHRVLVAVLALSDLAFVEEGKPPSSFEELLGGQERHDVGVAQEAVLADVAPRAARAGGLQRRPQRHRADHAGQDHTEADHWPGDALHPGAS